MTEQAQTNNNTIAKNTIFLYFRMMFTMVVALYTSRVILRVLGINDYGTYQTVGGVVGLLSFLNGALSTGTSRFLTFELGTGNYEKLKKTFSTALSAHVLLSLLIALLAETIGLWFVYNKLVIAPERINAAVFAYHLSILTAIIQITQVPYNASIISHERMEIYAYTSIVEVSLKLGIVYLLTIGDFDKLKLYSTLLCIVQIGLALFYRFYCVHHFNETKYSFILDKTIMKNVLSYSGWNLFANTSIALIQQGSTILINMFFSPGVVTSRAIANQVNLAANQFIGNFRTASNPQIVKKYAAQDYTGSKHLLLLSTRFSYYLMLILALPIFLVAKPLLQLWLGQVPPYSVIFLQLTIVTSLFQVFDTSFYTALYAKGRIKENAMISPTIGFLCFPVIYLLFKWGFSPISLAWVLLFSNAIIGLIVKPILVVKIVNYTWKDIFSVFIPCFKVSLFSIPIPVILYVMQNTLFTSTIIRFLCLTGISILCVGTASWFLGINCEMRSKLVNIAKIKLKDNR